MFVYPLRVGLGRQVCRVDMHALVSITGYRIILSPDLTSPRVFLSPKPLQVTHRPQVREPRSPSSHQLVNVHQAHDYAGV